jgi:transcriptional regulator with XRE-family HTH domain
LRLRGSRGTIVATTSATSSWPSPRDRWYWYSITGCPGRVEENDALIGDAAGAHPRGPAAEDAPQAPRRRRKDDEGTTPAPVEPFHVYLRRGRLAADLTQEQVARDAQISLVYYARLEQGRSRNPSAQKLARIARAIGATADLPRMLDLVAAANAPSAPAPDQGNGPGSQLADHLKTVFERLPPSSLTSDRDPFLRMVTNAYRRSAGTGTEPGHPIPLEEREHVVSFLIRAKDRRGLVHDVSGVFVEERRSIAALSAVVYPDGTASVWGTVVLTSKAQERRIRERLAVMKGVLGVDVIPHGDAPRGAATGTRAG